LTGLLIALLLLGITIGIAVTAISGGVAADPPAHVPPHRHFKYSASGEKVYVGPNFCSNAATAKGFSNFHRNVHLVDPGVNDIWFEPC
jgi:hypothetical protein